ncbi:MAG: hypothetical protein M0R51_18120, partial [Clostridia bacterium]|nr:hypothetical protein [Clostridia bacterium]
SAKAFIYSGKYAHHAVDFYWDGIYINSNISNSYQIGGNDYRVPPSLGAISFSSITASNVADYIENFGCIDTIWGEMSGQIYESYPSTHKYNMYPQNNIFPNKMRYVYYGYNYYDYKLTVEQSVPIDEYEGQYCNLQQHPLMISGGGIKIPFFKGYMPCLHRAGRYNNILNYAKYAYTRFYTTRCMYHPYDLTRAFFSPDIIFKKFYNISEDVRYIKPIRKTIYSGLEGVVGYEHNATAQTTDITNSYFKPDCWKTFFARPGQMAFNLKPFDTDNADEFNFKQDWLRSKITDFNALMAFFSHKPIGNSKIRMHQNPVSLMHSVRKYFKIESPRECMPVNFCNLIDNKRPNSFDITSGSNVPINIDGYRNVDYYIDHAYDFTVNAASDAPITMNNIELKTYGMKAETTWAKYGGGARTSTLWAAMDNVSALVGYKGSFFASNRTFKMIPYFSIGFDVNNSIYNPEEEYPNTVTGSYRNMLDYTQQYYDRYVKLSQYNIKNHVIDMDKSSLGTTNVNDPRDSYNNQYSQKDIYVDKVYEDLTLVNLYKNNPENISDITTYYSYTTEMYYEIGSCLSTDVILKRNNNNPVRTQIQARGDCFLDRVYFKHTSWLPTRLGLGTDNFNGSGTWSNRKVDTNWEEPGATNEGGYTNYAPYFTQATTGYSHGVTIGVITENKYNVAMRGQFDLKTMNAYPYSSNMPNETSSSDFMSRAKRKNLFMVYAEAGIVSGGLTFTMYEAAEFNDAYNRMLGYISYAMENSKIKFINKNFNNRIRWSYKKIEGSYIDGWKQFDYANYHDYDQKYGPIKRIENFNGLLFSMMNNGILRHDFEGKEIQVTPEQMLSVGGNRLLAEDALLKSVL